jgi:hypothetical protein
MGGTGAGGLGAVSAELSHPLVWLGLALVAVLVAAGLWKVLKLLWTALSG